MMFPAGRAAKIGNVMPRIALAILAQSLIVKIYKMFEVKGGKLRWNITVQIKYQTK
jgi:hypothetical protein